MEKAREFFESYGMLLESGYEKVFASKSEEDALKVNDAEIQAVLGQEIEKWKDMPFAGLENASPFQYVSGLADLEEVMTLFELGARMCDGDLPEILLDKLRTFGEAGIQALVQLSLREDLIRDEDGIYLPKMAAKVLGKWGISSAAAPWVQLLYKLDGQQEIMVEELIDALEGIGAPALEPMTQALENENPLGYIDEYVLSALVKVGRKFRNDRTYLCIKQCFLRMEDKILGAMCMGDYGDSRAIPFLRGYLEKNRAKLDKETYNEIKAAVKRLGGSVQDL